MDRFKRYRPSPAMIVAIIALVLSLGGTSYAAITLPRNSVGTTQIKKNAVIGSKVKNGSLSTADISSASLSKLGRVAIASDSKSVAPGANVRVAQVTLKAPTKGFVLVNGWVTAWYPNARWGVTVGEDGSTAGRSPYINAVIGNGGENSGSNSAVFPVAAGTHNFSVRVEGNSATNTFTAAGTITAQFIPYNGVGTKTAP